MIILHVAPISRREIGGLHVSVPALIAAQDRLEGVHTALVATAADGGQPPGVTSPVFQARIRQRGAGRLSLPAPFDRPHLAVFHSTYIPVHALIAAQLRKAAIPYVICPRGGMTHYAQTYRRWKKTVGNLLFFRKMVSHAAAIHCLTRGEADASAGWNRPVFVVGNGIHPPERSRPAGPGRSAGRQLVFIGRLHVQYKGLDMLLRACHLARDELRQAGAGVELYGPDCSGSARLLARQIARLHLDGLVKLSGPVVGDAKAALLRRADVFLHPSRSEGHPMAVLEALAYGVPCLVTPVTNMAEEVAAAGAGWKMEPSPQGIAAGIRKAVTDGIDALQAAGEKARRLAVENYGWDKIAARSVEAYRKYAA